jgi:transposase
MSFNELSDDEWELLTALVSDGSVVNMNRRGRPRIEPRVVSNAVLWVLTTGKRWSKLPAHYPSAPTCRHRFEEWQMNGTLAQIIERLSKKGRSFPYIPEPQSRSRIRNTKPDVDTFPRVLWRSPESWRGALDRIGECHSIETVTGTTRQLYSVGHEMQAPVPTLTPESESVKLSESRRRTPWMGLWASGKQIVDRRGYVIYVAAHPVHNQMFRGWTEIVQDDKRIERSGLLEPRFAEADAAERCALDWARQWIDRHCCTPAAHAQTAAVKCMHVQTTTPDSSKTSAPPRRAPELISRASRGSRH